MGLYEAIESFRLKSERRKIRLRKKDKEKQLLALHREEKSIRQQIRNLGYEPLIPPVQKGWKRIFVLRDDVQRSPRAAFFQILLDKINTVQYSDAKKFTVRKRKRGRKFRVPKEQKLQRFYEHEWQKSKLTEAEAVFFTQTLEMDRAREYRTVYVFNDPWRFVLKVIPNMITEVRIRDIELEQRSEEISYYLEKSNLRHKLNRLVYGSARNRWYIDTDKPQYENPLANKPLREILTSWINH